MYQNDPLKCLTGEVVCSYVHLDAPHAMPGSTNAKYSVTLLIPKTDVATKADIDAAIAAAAQEATPKTWGGVRPPIIATPIHDGDGVKQDGTPYGPECKGHWVLAAGNATKPYFCDISNVRCELPASEAYSGMYARCTIRFFGYSNAGKKGIGCGLRGVMKTRDGEPLSASRADASEFADFAQPLPSVDPLTGLPY